MAIITSNSVKERATKSYESPKRHTYESESYKATFGDCSVRNSNDERYDAYYSEKYETDDCDEEDDAYCDCGCHNACCCHDEDDDKTVSKTVLRFFTNDYCYTLAQIDITNVPNAQSLIPHKGDMVTLYELIDTENDDVKKWYNARREYLISLYGNRDEYMLESAIYDEQFEVAKVEYNYGYSTTLIDVTLNYGHHDDDIF